MFKQLKLLVIKWVVFVQMVSEKLTLVIISRLDRISLIFKVFCQPRMLQ